MDYFELMKRVIRARHSAEPCTQEYTSCPCAVCEGTRRDHWADQQFEDQREEQQGGYHATA